MMSASAALGEDYGYCFRPEPGGQLPLPGTGPSKWARQLVAKKILAEEMPRLGACCHNVKRRALGVAVKRKGDATYFGGLYMCAAVWVCPVCAQRISEVRRAELQQAIDNALAMGYGLLLITLTFPHGAGDVLATILENFLDAARALKSGRAAVDRNKRIRYIGEVRTLEVTHGVNGWHPHSHAIAVLERPLTPEEVAALKAELHDAWAKACASKGLPEPSFAHGVDIRSARHDIAQYVAKWGADEEDKWGFAGELAYTPRKRAKQGGSTPGQLLGAAAEGDVDAAALWKEFALAFFGKRQLFWSRRKTGRKVQRTVYLKKTIPGRNGMGTRNVKIKMGVKLVDEWVSLRDELSLPPELTDQQVMELEEPEREQTLVMLDLDTWHVIRKVRAQSQVLELAAGDDERQLFLFLNHLRSVVPMEDGRPPGPLPEWEL